MSSMPHRVEQVIEELTEIYLRKAPAEWIRLVVWVGRLAEPDGSPAPADIKLNRVVTWSNGQLGSAYTKAFGTSDIYRRLEEELAGTPEAGWTQLRIELDRDGVRRVDFVTDEPRRAFDNAATDPYWRQVHDYVDLNVKDLEGLVDRLRQQADLPPEQRPSEEPRRRRVLSYFRTS